MNDIWTGVTWTGECASCAKCGGIEVELMEHMDAPDHYSSVYRCTNCGARITHRADRTGEDARWWGVDN